MSNSMVTEMMNSHDELTGKYGHLMIQIHLKIEYNTRKNN